MSTIDEAARTRALTHFEDAEQALMHRHGVTIARTHRLTLSEPALTARVIESGQGAPVVLVHGGGSSAAEWAPLLGELQGYRCLAVDRPGCGASDPFDYTGVDVRAHAVAFLEGVLDELGLRRASFVANSMGGLWAMWLALDRPERVASLALLGCPALLSGTSAPLPLRMLGTRGLNRVLFGLQRASPKQMRTILGHVAGADAAERMSPEFVETAYRAEVVPGAQTAWRTLLERVVRLRGGRVAFSEDEIRCLRQRTLLIWGRDDAFGAAQHGRRACDLLPDGRFELVDGGHLPWWNDPRRCAELVSTFLSSAEPPGAGTGEPGSRRPTPGQALHAASQKLDPRRCARRRQTGRVTWVRPVVAAASLLVICAAPAAVARTGDSVREGKRNGTTAKETEIIGNITAKPTKGGYVTRQSNISTGATAGGAAIYGCRTRSDKMVEAPPCLRATNLAGGFAFELATSEGIGGRITIGDPDVPNPGRPFTTNATGIAVGLNAERVGSRTATEILEAARAKQGLDADTVDGVDSLKLASAEEAATDDDNDLLLAGEALSAETVDVSSGNGVMVAGHVTLDNEAALAREVRCFLRRTDGTILARGGAFLSATDTGGEEAHIAFTAVDVLGATTTYQVFCDPINGADNDVRANSSGIVAMAVQAVQDDVSP